MRHYTANTPQGQDEGPKSAVAHNTTQRAVAVYVRMLSEAVPMIRYERAPGKEVTLRALKL